MERFVAMPALRWGQFTRAGLIPQVTLQNAFRRQSRGDVPHGPESLTIRSVRLGPAPIVELRMSLRSANLIPPKKRAPSAALGALRLAQAS
jgi:hypothetical protein